MTCDQVRKPVRLQAEAAPNIRNHGTELCKILVAPKQIFVIARTVQDGKAKDDVISVWLIAQENSPDGYRIVMRNDGSSFGLASPGFPSDKHLILCGWYGGLSSAFVSM